MNKRGFSILIAVVLLSGCAGTKSDNGSDPRIKNISGEDLVKAETVKEYENRQIRFKARFEKIESGSDWRGLEQYRTTHFLISLLSEDKETMLPNVLVPAFETILTKLDSGDLLQIEGELRSLPEEGSYVLASKIEKI